MYIYPFSYIELRVLKFQGYYMQNIISLHIECTRI